MPRFLAIDADARGLFVAAATVRGGSVKLEQTLALVEDGQPLSPSTAKALGAKLREGLKQAGVPAAPVLVCLGRERVILDTYRTGLGPHGPQLADAVLQVCRGTR